MASYPIDIAKLEAICRRYHVDSLSLFGSLVRGEATPECDIDLIVTFTKRVGNFHMVALEQELTEALGRKVDLLTEAAISPYLRERIFSERQVIYAA